MAPLRLGTSSDAPARIAAIWVERLTSGEVSEAEIAEFKAWLAADPANRKAYERSRAVYTELGRTRLRHRRPVLRLVGGGALAAGVAAALLLVFPSADHATATGEMAQFALPDGTRVWLDSDSAIDVAFDDDRRTITLREGRAAFAVAPDGRQFTVEAGDARVTDIGTEFSVDRLGPLAVEVSEGAVEIERSGERTRLNAGERASFRDGTALRSATGPDRLAWRERRIMLDRTSLARALAELDRHYPGRIVLVDSALANRRVSGSLLSDRIDDGLDSLARSQRLTITRLPWLRLVSAADQENR